MLKSILRFVKLKLLALFTFVKRCVFSRSRTGKADNPEASSSSAEIDHDRFVIVQGGGDTQEALLASSNAHLPSNCFPSYTSPSNVPIPPPEVIKPSEPDFFHDMVPEFKRPKTLYIDPDANPSAEEMERKFRFDSNRVVQLDDQRFVDFGRIEACGNGQESGETQGWEEEGAWDGLEHIQHDARQMRIHKHRQLNNNNNRHKTIRTLGAVKKEAID